MTLKTLTSPEYYINRELSLLAFNHRVLELAQDKSLPLLERLRFLCISSTNLDEFFEVRVAGVKQQVYLNINQTYIDGHTPQTLELEISEQAHDLVTQQYQCLNQIMLPTLEKENIRFLHRSAWNEEQKIWLENYFHEDLMPVLSPLGLDPAHPFPNVLNKSLNFVVTLEGRDAFGRASGTAIVPAPRTLPRLIRLPKSVAENPETFVFLSSILHAYIYRLFPGMKVTGCFQFRVTRNSNMYVDEEEIDDLLKALKGELPQRNYGAAVRLEVADNCPAETACFLLKQLGLEQHDLYQVDGPVNLNRLMRIVDVVERDDLHFPSFIPLPLKPEVKRRFIFRRIRQGDVLLHHPFDSFEPIINFIKAAAHDPNVLAIKQTLYRTGKNSEIVKYLIQAAKKGKEVTVIVELRARFDEEANIHLADKLQKAGVHVVYGVVGYKTHAKLILIVRREGKKLRRYAHLGTGNYHAGTAKAYTDYGLLTCHKDIGEDVHKMFQLMTGLGRTRGLKYLLEAPFTLHKMVIAKIQRETEHARKGGKAKIMARMNSLIEPKIIAALYEASQAGVHIEMIVRGICCLRPGIEGISENIHIRSVMGRFLEHPRIFYFYNNGAEELYGSSADWMPRNFFRRVETAFPILDKKLVKRIKRDSLDNYMRDNVQAWVLQANGCYCRQTLTQGELTHNEAAHSAQSSLIPYLLEKKDSVYNA